MAHMIEMRTDGTGAAAYAFKPAWHNLGVVLPDGFITSDKAFELVPELARVITKVPVEYNGMVVPDKYFTVRDGDALPLGIVGDRYTVLQNKDALNLLDSLVVGGSAQYESVMSLHDGARVALVVNLNDLGVKIAGVDAVDAYLLLTNSHDGSTSVTAAVTPVRVVCQNTLTYALNTTKLVHKVRHSTNMEDKLREIDKILDMTQSYMSEFEADATKLMHTKMSDSEWEQFLGKLIVIPEDKSAGLVNKNGKAKTDRGVTLAKNTHEALTQVWVNLSQTAAADFKHTQWGAIQAVSHFNQRTAPVQAKGKKPKHMTDFAWAEAQDRKREENRFERTMSGGSNLTEKAHKILVAA